MPQPPVSVSEVLFRSPTIGSTHPGLDDFGFLRFEVKPRSHVKWFLSAKPLRSAECDQRTLSPSGNVPGSPISNFAVPKGLALCTNVPSARASAFFLLGDPCVAEPSVSLYCAPRHWRSSSLLLQHEGLTRTRQLQMPFAFFFNFFDCSFQLVNQTPLPPLLKVFDDVLT